MLDDDSLKLEKCNKQYTAPIIKLSCAWINFFYWFDILLAVYHYVSQQRNVHFQFHYHFIVS
jgi:hypothetical protein